MRKSMFILTCICCLEVNSILMNHASSRFPNEVVIIDAGPASQSDGTSTPAGEGEDDFFSSWDKPTIKRPSNPPSRTATPPVVSRTDSPFLNAGANGNGVSRPKSPLSGSDDKSPVSDPPVAVRSNPAVRKTAAVGAKKGSVLGSKKAPKLGAKKLISSDAIDFEEAEKRAKEEAERIAKLGYDPEAERAAAEAKKSGSSASKIAAPTPVSPTRGSFGATRSHERSSSEIERLGMGLGRLGFGQVGAAAKAPAPKKLGFGATAASKAADGKWSSRPIGKLASVLTSCPFRLFRRGTRICQTEIWQPERDLLGRVLWSRSI